MASITSSGATPTAVLKKIRDHLLAVNAKQDRANVLAEELLEAIKDITNK